MEGLQPGEHGGDPDHAQARPGARDQGGAAPVRFGGAAADSLVGFSRCPAKSKIPAAPATCSCRACSLAVCRALACQVLQLTVFPLFCGLALGRGENTKTAKISALRILAPESPTVC